MNSFKLGNDLLWVFDFIEFDDILYRMVKLTTNNHLSNKHCLGPISQ